MSLFDDWTESREIRSIGTNTGAPPLAFQSWHRFKEAFPPEFVHRALRDGAEDIRACLDPFGGSGTTALAAQFLGISSTTIEVNPFLADVIKAKLASYDADDLAREFAGIRRCATRLRIDPTQYFAEVPPTFIESGSSDRWLFSFDVAAELASILTAVDALDDALHRRFFRVLVGGLLADVSNFVVSGKGRRYRRDWRNRQATAADVSRILLQRVELALADTHRFAGRPAVLSNVINGDARRVRIRRKHDVAVFSPPYPNSFDYTDVYNVELWMLGYLSTASDNRALRGSTLTSHVQLARDYAEPPIGSRTLRRTMSQLTTSCGKTLEHRNGRAGRGRGRF